METSKTIIPLATNRAIELMKVGNEFRIDSRIVAKGIGIEHRAFIQTLRKYQNRLERWGVLTFEMTKPLPNSEGGRPEIYVMLNKKQISFAITLSRNTEQVVDFKFDLIEAFDIVTRDKTHLVPTPERAFLPPAEKDQYIFHVIECLGRATGRDVQRYCRWYSGREARRRMEELAEQGELVKHPMGKTIRYSLPRKQIA